MKAPSRVGSITLLGSTLFAASAGTDAAETEGWTQLIGQRGLAGWRTPAGPFRRNPGDPWVDAGSVRQDADDEKRLVSGDGTGVLVNGRNGRTHNLFSRQEFADVELHVEFMVPKGSNSGVYLMGRYEIQVLDSWGVAKPKYSDCGGIYQRWDPGRGKGREGYEGRTPRVNASRPPGEWQTFDIVFRAPRFDADGRKTRNAVFVKVVHNGQVIHEDQELTGPTRAAGFADERPTGPLMVQGDHGPVAYRNIRVRELK